MDTERTSVTGIVKFVFNYKLTGADIRPCPYSRAAPSAYYQPFSLHFTLRARTSDGTAPSYDDLTADGADLYGYKLKKDGTPGLTEIREHFFYCNAYPDWISRIIEKEALELREGV